MVASDCADECCGQRVVVGGKLGWGIRVFADGCDSMGVTRKPNCIVVILLELRGRIFGLFAFVQKLQFSRELRGSESSEGRSEGGNSEFWANGRVSTVNDNSGMLSCQVVLLYGTYSNGCVPAEKALPTF